MFKLSKQKRTVVFTDLFSFFKMSLNKSVSMYLKTDGKDSIDVNLLNTDLTYWNDNLDDIINYCIKDCKLTNQLAEYFILHLLKSRIALPRYLVSAGSLAKTDFRFNCFIPNFDQVPKPIIQIAYNCYYGGKFEIQKKGFFKNLWLYDINSQYPSFIINLPNLNLGVWKKVNNIPLSECLGYFLVNLDIPDYIYLSTICYKLKSNQILTVIGQIKNKWLTWYDLDLMRDFITKIHFGTVFIPTKNYNEIPKEKIRYYYPFRERILHHHKKKTRYKDNNEIMYSIHKLTMNSLYGSFIERHKDNNSVGLLFNPIYASQITAFGRWSVIKEIDMKDWNIINAIHTDSIIVNTDISNKLKIDNELGNWSLEKKGKGIILNTGMYQIGYKNAVRGIPKKFIKNWLRFCLKYKEFESYTFELDHMRKLSEGLVRDKSLVNVNTMVKDIKTVNCNSDKKRHWKDSFENFDDLLSRNIDSLPYYANMEKKDNKLDLNTNLFLNPNLV